MLLRLLTPQHLKDALEEILFRLDNAKDLLYIIFVILLTVVAFVQAVISCFDNIKQGFQYKSDQQIGEEL